MALLLLCFVLVSTMAQVIKGGGELVVRVEAVENKFANPYTMLAAMAMLGVGYAVGRLWNARCYWKKEERYKMKIELLKETVADLEQQQEERFRRYVIWHTEAQKKQHSIRSRTAQALMLATRQRNPHRGLCVVTSARIVYRACLRKD